MFNFLFNAAIHKIAPFVKLRATPSVKIHPLLACVSEFLP